jgi:uncharacterized protein (DUF58 family)
MLTRSGFGAAITAVVLAVAGWAWRYEELMVIALCIAAALVVAVWAARAPTQLTITRFVPAPRVARGDPITVEYRVSNRRRRRSVPATIIDCAQPMPGDSPTAPLGRPPLTPVEIRVPVPPVDHLDRTDVVGHIPTSRRGMFNVGPWALERVDPFGLAVGRVASTTTSTIIVHPRVHALGGPYGDTHSVQDDAMVRRSASDPLSGFVSLREYVDGDDPRLIHWPTTARMGTLMLREHIELRRPEFTLVLDTADTAPVAGVTPGAAALQFEDDFEEMVDVTASIAVHALRSGVEVRLRTTSRDYPGAAVPLAADTQVLDLLTPVVPTSPGHTASLAATLHGQAVVQHQNAMVVVVTGPSGPSQALGPIVTARIVRVGAGAQLAPGVSLAVADALEFARRWVAWE